RHHEDAAVALLRGRNREPDPCIARRRLDDRSAGLQLSFALGLLDHAEPDPVFDGAPRIQVVELRQQSRLDVAADLVQPDDRRVADELEHGGVLAGHWWGSLISGRATKGAGMKIAT